MLKKSLILVAIASSLAVGCSAEAVDDDQDLEDDPLGSSESELRSAFNCSTERQDAYSGGTATGPVDVIKVGGKRVTKATGHAFLKWQKAADAVGVSLGLNSGFRTMAEQQYFYDCYKTGRCNNGNLAARPGYSNHQSGRAIDVSGSGSTWVQNNAERFGFRRTVPSEAWHFEYTGADPGGPCSTAAPSTAGASCNSTTLGRVVSENACVQARSDRQWYRCRDGSWFETSSNDTACASRYPL